MDKFIKHSGTALPLRRSNVDTDQIIPARFLKMNRQQAGGYGPYLFHDLSHTAEGVKREDFILNTTKGKAATALIAEQNFGCGSSREGAVYAFVDRGFQAVLAPSFGDIFFSNCLKNGLLPIQLSEAVIASLLTLAERSSESFAIEVDLDKQQVRWKDDSQKQVSSDFPLDPFWRECLLKGVDEIDLTLSYLPQIERFETEYLKRNPWLVSP